MVRWRISYPALVLRGEVILDGVCRVGKVELERAGDHFGFSCASEDYAKVLERKPDIVVVSSPHKFHFEHAMRVSIAGSLGLVTVEFDADRCVILLNDGTVESLPLKSPATGLSTFDPVQKSKFTCVGRDHPSTDFDKFRGLRE